VIGGGSTPGATPGSVPGATATTVFTPDASKQADALAEEEAAKLGAGLDLEHDSRRQEHARHQTFRNQVNLATLILFWVIVICVGLGVLVFAWHLITPASLHWLSDAARDKLQTLLAAALLSSALTGYVNRRLS
jgi:hypothetical protein